jgi:hypothetical protein
MMPEKYDARLNVDVIESTGAFVVDRIACR